MARARYRLEEEADVGHDALSLVFEALTDVCASGEIEIRERSCEHCEERLKTYWIVTNRPPPDWKHGAENWSHSGHGVRHKVCEKCKNVKEIQENFIVVETESF